MTRYFPPMAPPKTPARRESASHVEEFFNGAEEPKRHGHNVNFMPAVRLHSAPDPLPIYDAGRYSIPTREQLYSVPEFQPHNGLSTEPIGKFNAGPDWSIPDMSRVKLETTEDPVIPDKPAVNCTNSLPIFRAKPELRRIHSCQTPLKLTIDTYRTPPDSSLSHFYVSAPASLGSPTSSLSSCCSPDLTGFPYSSAPPSSCGSGDANNVFFPTRKSGQVRYSRRNNPELEKRRVHFCNFPGNNDGACR